MASTWEYILELQPTLCQCRVLLQKQLHGDAAPFDHSAWSVSVCVDNTLLNVALAPKDCHADMESEVVAIAIGTNVQITSNCLRSYTDHLCLVLLISPGSFWLQKLARDCRGVAEDELYDVRCRDCSSLLLEAEQKSGFVLPIHAWDTCSELVTCECCSRKGLAPKRIGPSQIQATRGRVYVYPATLLVCAGDLCPLAVATGRDGLLRCQCGFVVGELPSSDGERLQRRRGARSMHCLLSQSWRSSRGCEEEGLSLYKHRISMHKPSEGCADSYDLLAKFTEEAAVGMQILSLRSQEGHSRFVLIPSKPEETFGGPMESFEEPFVENVDAFGHFLELRVLTSEVLIVGPSTLAVDVPVQRAAKVCFRRRRAAVSQYGCVVVVPYWEFEAVCRALNRWCAVLPPSLRRAPPLGKDDENGIWQTSYLPLPPQDGGLE